MPTGLNIKVSSLLPVTGVALELSLLDEDLWIQVRYVLVAVFTMELLRLVKLFKGDVDLDTLINHTSLDIVLCSLFKLVLVSKDLRLKPDFVQIIDVVHFFRSFTQIDVLQFTNMHESFTCKVELLVEKSLDTKFTPI